MELFVGRLVVMGLQGWDGVVCSHLCSHFGEDYCMIVVSIEGKKEAGNALHTIERGIHPPDIHQQTNHGHVNGSRPITLHPLLEHFTHLATPGHGVEIDVREAEAPLTVRVPSENFRFVIKEGPKEVILNVLAPEREAIFFFEMAHLVA